MLPGILADFYERDLGKWIEELESFPDEQSVWITTGSVRNPAGNLALHIIGGLNFLIGAKLAHTDYTRNRDKEFTEKNIPKALLVEQLKSTSIIVTKTLRALPAEQLDLEYPMPFDGAIRTNGYLLVTLLAHVNYHLGQVNYLRRMQA